MEKEKVRKHSIYKSGRLIDHRNYDAEKRRICFVHLELANKVNATEMDPKDKEEILAMIDEVFDMGKRMDAKLDEYHTERIALGMGIEKGLKEGF